MPAEVQKATTKVKYKNSHLEYVGGLNAPLMLTIHDRHGPILYLTSIHCLRTTAFSFLSHYKLIIIISHMSTGRTQAVDYQHRISFKKVLREAKKKKLCSRFPTDPTFFFSNNKFQIENIAYRPTLPTFFF